MTVYLNTYKVHQAYGGHEEGGWWYEVGEPIQSIIVDQFADLDDLQNQRDQKAEHWLNRWDKIVFHYTEAESQTERKNRLSKILDKIESMQDSVYTTGVLAKWNCMANEIDKALEEDQPIPELYKETGGYSFVIGSDDEDEIPSAYHGDCHYDTRVENHFAESFPAKRPRYE